MNDSEIIKDLECCTTTMSKSCWDCIHCDVCANIDGFSHHVSDVSKCKRFKDKADVEPVKHGEWKIDREINSQNYEKYYCSVCGNYAKELEYEDDFITRYCYWCGAKMDGKEVQE